MEKKLSAERAAMIYSMEKIIRSLNNEDAMDSWLSMGLPDGEIDADISDAIDTEILKLANYYGELDDYSDDGNFADLMDTFISCIVDALYLNNPSVLDITLNRTGILFSDGVSSHD